MGEHGEIGNAADVVLCRQTREPFRIDLHHNCTTSKVAGGLRHVRRRHPARPAPGSPEVRQNGNLAVANDLVELLFVDFDRFADCRQLRLAGTAFANIGKVLGGNTIGPTARGAISNQRHGPILGRFSRSSGTHFAHQVLENLGGTADLRPPFTRNYIVNTMYHCKDLVSTEASISNFTPKLLLV
jgi:hypothetical protein